MLGSPDVFYLDLGNILELRDRCARLVTSAPKRISCHREALRRYVWEHVRYCVRTLLNLCSNLAKSMFLQKLRNALSIINIFVKNSGCPLRKSRFEIECLSRPTSLSLSLSTTRNQSDFVLGCSD